MVNRSKVLNRAYSYVVKNWFIFFSIFFYVFFTAYYMGPSVTSCSTTVYGFGDNTAGPIWRESLPEDQGILGAQTSMTNAPFGDKLYSPVGYSFILQTVVIKTISSVAGPICGYNIVNMLGFFLSALVMFGFVYSVTHRKWIALLAGYAASFAPYYQMKIGGHPSYGYQAIFIGIIWAFYRLIKYQKKKDALLLGALFSIAVYFDPYFTLFAALILGSLAVAWAGVNNKIFNLNVWKDKTRNFQIKKQLKLLIMSLTIIIVFLTPLIAVFATQSRQINANVAASRGNVLAEAQACSNWPHEYLVPFVLHPVFQKLFGKERYISSVDSLRDNLSCGIGEDSVGLSVTLVLVVFFGLSVFLWEKLNGRRIGIGDEMHYDARLLIVGMLVLAAVAIAIGLPPLKIQGIIPTPSYELLAITSTWRTLARVYMLVNISLVVLSAIVFVYFAKHFQRHQRFIAVLFVMIFIAVFVEYQAFRPFSGNSLSTFSYNKDVPPVYSWLKGQKSIKTIAEYPLERSSESDATSYYLTMQPIHGKKLFNSALAYSPQEKLKQGLKNLSDPQTLRVLKAMGVDAVVAHGIDGASVETLPNAKILHTAPKAQFSLSNHTPTVKDDMTVVIGLENIIPATSIITLDKGFVRNVSIISSAVNWQYEAVQGSVLGIEPIPGKNKLTGDQNVCFDVKMSAQNDTALLSLNIDGKKGPSVNINDKYQPIRIKAIKSVTLNNSNGHNMRLENIGCGPDAK